TDPPVGAGRADRRREGVAIWVADRSALEWRVEVNDLTARREHRNPWTLAHPDASVPDRCEKTDLGGAQDGPRLEDSLAFPQILAGLTDGHPLRGRGRDRDDVARVVGVLDPDDGVRAIRHRRAGHDAHRFAGS